VSKAGTIELLALEVGHSLQSLAERCGTPAAATDYLESLGLRPPSGFVAKLVTPLSNAATAAGALPGLLTALQAAIDAGNVSAIISAGEALTDAITTLLDATKQLATAIGNAGNDLSDPAERADVTAFASEFFLRSLSLLLGERIEASFPMLHGGLLLSGILEHAYETGSGTAVAVPFVRRVFHLDRLGTLLRDPSGYLMSVFEWGAPDFDGLVMLRTLDTFLEDQVGIPADLFAPSGSPAVLEAYAFNFAVNPSTSPPGLKLGVRVPATQDFASSFNVLDNWALDLDAKARFSMDTSATLTPPLQVSLSPPTPGETVDVDLSIGLRRTAAAGPLLLIGEADGSRIDVGGVSAGLGFLAKWNPTTGRAEAEPRVSGELSKGQVIVSVEKGDGLLGKLVGNRALEAAFGFKFSWTPSGGLSLQGGGVELTLPLHAELGPVTFLALRLGLSLGAGLEVSIGADLTAKLGPVALTVEDLGVIGTAEFPSGGSNLGLVGFKTSFKTPKGVGIAINAGPVTGGGFLFFDEPNGRYGGALVLKIYSVNVKAFGVIETKLPDGTKGFSFVIVISAEFTPIQLGLGFTLNGVGGMLGINRRIDEEGLRRAVRDGSLGHLLFPHNLEENAPQIIHDLVAVLPAADGRHVFGPMAKIGWGSPTLIEADLGIILELPGPRLALLGEVRAALPKKDKALVLINLSVAGLLDFPRKFFAIDASLHDSRVGSYPISGDMAMRLSWGDDPSFALAVGGFNPGFQPPPSFPKLRRVAVDLGVSGNPSLTLQGYFAITSNTAQVGALAELNASGAGIQLYARVQFDALIVFSPFAFEVAIAAQARVSFHGRGIGVHLHGVVSGPSPWRVRGRVCVSILFWDACLGFDKTFGTGQRVELPEINLWKGTLLPDGKTDVLGLQEALQDKRNWTPDLPPGAQLVVSLSEPAGDDTDRPVDPLGAVTVRERVCPLNKKLDRFGPVKPAGPGRFQLESATINLKSIALADVSYVKEPFAPAQYFKMSDSEKLSAPSFQKLDGGLTVKGNARNIAPGSVEHQDIQYKTKRLGGPPPSGDHALPADQLARMSKRAGAGLFGLRRLAAPYLDPTAPRKFTVADELFVIANLHDLTSRTDLTPSPISKIEALFKLRDHRAANANAAPLAVLPKFEVGNR
jgi:hypothetical protein